MDDWLRALPPEWFKDCDPRVCEIAKAAYETPGRHYHTWAHVEDCVGKLRQFPCDAPRSIFLALLFHDAIYAAGKRDNEALSAALATSTLEVHSRVPEDERATIHRMIMATQDHHPPEGAHHDLRVVLDIDMSILGAEEAAYRRYAKDVEREWVPSVTTPRRFRIGRIAFLQKVLDSPRIFATEEGMTRWEGNARRNVADEIDRLRARQGWLERAAGRFVR
jgi:predicted metal-dependent HD superfamily phosphohydrolase